jgi:hypothetical protein
MELRLWPPRCDAVVSVGCRVMVVSIVPEHQVVGPPAAWAFKAALVYEWAEEHAANVQAPSGVSSVAEV